MPPANHLAQAGIADQYRQGRRNALAHAARGARREGGTVTMTTGISRAGSRP